MNIDSQKIPQNLQDLVPLARKFGILDERCREYVISRIASKERKSLATTVLSRSKELREWIRSFPVEKLTAEATAFMCLLDAAEEAFYSAA